MKRLHNIVPGKAARLEIVDEARQLLELFFPLLAQAIGKLVFRVFGPGEPHRVYRERWKAA